MIIISVISICTQQCGLGGLDDSLKDNFYDKLIRAVRKLREREIVATPGGFHGHVGSNAEDSEEQHTGYGYGVRIKEGGILGFCAVVNTTEVTQSPYETGLSRTQVDYCLVRRNI